MLKNILKYIIYKNIELKFLEINVIKDMWHLCKEKKIQREKYWINGIINYVYFHIYWFIDF